MILEYFPDFGIFPKKLGEIHDPTFFKVETLLFRTHLGMTCSLHITKFVERFGLEVHVWDIART